MKTYVVNYSEIHLATVHQQLIVDLLVLLSNMRQISVTTTKIREQSVT